VFEEITASAKAANEAEVCCVHYTGCIVKDVTDFRCSNSYYVKCDVRAR